MLIMIIPSNFSLQGSFFNNKEFIFSDVEDQIQTKLQPHSILRKNPTEPYNVKTPNTKRNHDYGE